MEYIVNILSVIFAYGFAIGCIYFFIDATIGRIKLLHVEFGLFGVHIKDVFLLIVAVLLASKLKVIRPLG